MEISVVCVAARITLDDTAASQRIALGAANADGVPTKGGRVGGGQCAPDTLRECGRIAANACSLIDDVRASARYRRLPVDLVPRTVERCVAHIAEASG